MPTAENFRRAPAVVRSNASAAKDNVVVYLCAPDGTIELAPDNRLTQKQLDKIGYKGWRRCEATGASEIEKLSIKLSKQEFERKKRMKVEQHLREHFELEQLKIRAKLRIAQGYSKNDEEMNKRILQRAERAESNLYRVIASEFDPTGRNTALAIEVKPRSTSPVASIAQKPEGISA